MTADQTEISQRASNRSFTEGTGSSVRRERRLDNHVFTLFRFLIFVPFQNRPTVRFNLIRYSTLP